MDVCFAVFSTSLRGVHCPAGIFEVPKSEPTELRILLVRAPFSAVLGSVRPFPRQNGYCKLVNFVTDLFSRILGHP